MVFHVEFAGGTVREWRRTADGVAVRRVTDYEPSLYVAAPDGALADLRAALEADPKVASTAFERRYTSLRATERARVLRVFAHRVDEVRTLAREIRHHHRPTPEDPGAVRLFNVDLTPGFRYCLDADVRPVPEHPLSSVRIRIDERALGERDLSRLELDDRTVRGAPEAVLAAVGRHLDRVDPDVLVLSHGDLVPLLAERAADLGLDEFALGRRPGWTRLAGANTYESYGRVGHSPARYGVPGRAVVDASNSFFWNQTSLAGLLDLVEWSHKPLQETAWGSIGNVLTAIESRHALERDVLVPWNKWEPEGFKSVRTLHAADRGGITFEPAVGLHEDVFEVDFASLYPNVICQHNVSPDTVCCDCHADRADVPELGYSVCDRRGFLPDVLEPLVEQRAAFKRRIRETDDPAAADALRSRSNALKWVLVACFGYQGYRNSKFGRIECHEAINAVARDVLLSTKERFEANGWTVLHGIVDSLWVKPTPDATTAPLEDVVRRVSEAVEIDLEREARYDWLCFVPRRDGQGGALTRYFGAVADGDGFKLRGIEARQRSTPSFVADAQRDLLCAFDRHRSAEAVVDRLRRHLGRLRAGDVPPSALVVEQRVSKRPGEYTRRTRTAAALARAESLGFDREPGQRVRYVVVDDDARSRERVRLAFEDGSGYDTAFYADLLVRACASVVSPLGWDEARVRRRLRNVRSVTLAAFE